jgi:DNA-binding transcriptional LysR family regulator
VPGLPSSEALLHTLRNQKLLPERRMTCGNLSLVKSLALGGVGVAMLPRRVAAADGTRGLRRLHARLPYAPDTIFLCYRADLHRTRAAMRLKDALVEYGRKLDRNRGVSV